MKTEIHTILAIDFDGTICDLAYPEVGKVKYRAQYYINELYKKGFGIVINTCREGKALAKALEFLDEEGFLYDYYNANFPHLIDEYQADTRKISADVYIDDKNLSVIEDGMPQWKTIYYQITNHYEEQIRSQRYPKGAPESS
jgi:hydroxymethylpyrimidine pyrophosphatase-like HAD family hydrolase